MPIYEYQCDQCGQIQEALQKISEKPLIKCAQCSGNLHKLISHSAFHLKGTGWYVTDYAGKKQDTDTKAADKAPAENDTSGASTASNTNKTNKTDNSE